MIIQDNNSKLTKTIASYLRKTPNTKIRLLPISSDVYKISCLHQSEKDYLFIVSGLTNAIASFIEEYHKTYNIYLYHDYDFSHPILDLCHNITTQKDTVIPNAIRIPNILNNIDFYPQEVESSKQYNICTFLNKHYNITQELIKFCEQNNIVMFDAISPNPYNLGNTTESEKNEILKSSMQYLNITNEYAAEASIVGCGVLRIGPGGELVKDSQIEHITVDNFLSTILKV
jgi:hypothetical protein